MTNEDIKLVHNQLSSFEIPECIIASYINDGLKSLFPWQLQCLNLSGVCNGSKNLVYSAPTGAGKTLVTEILLIKKLISNKGKKAMFIQPFVSVAREKMFALKSLCEGTGLNVDGYMSGHRPPGGVSKVDIVVCTIEKANNIINRLIEGNGIKDFCFVSVDEIHMVGDPNRGYLLELLLSKLKFFSTKSKSSCLQIVGMSATVPNLPILAEWLDAEVFQTSFRPVPLTRLVMSDGKAYNIKSNVCTFDFPKFDFENDDEFITSLSYKTICEGNCVLIFCPTKMWCEKLSLAIAKNLFLYHKNREFPTILKDKSEKLYQIFLQLQRSPSGLDDVLKLTIPYGVAYHHAGLTVEERDIIESGFRNSTIHILIATSTLSSGVNLPARRVIIRTPNFHGKPLDLRMYHQMSGRAGRKGKDTVGESLLICKPSEKSAGLELISADIPPVNSCLFDDEFSQDYITSSFKRLMMEVIGNGLVSTTYDVLNYMKSTFYYFQQNENTSKNKLNEKVVRNCLNWLVDKEFIYIQKNEESGSEKVTPTQLGRAALLSSLPTGEALLVLADLQNASKAFALDSELHLVYQVTPIFIVNQLSSIDWFNFVQIYQILSPAHKNASRLIGVKESFLTKMAATGGELSKRNIDKQQKMLNVHIRFYAALILNDLINELQLSEICSKYQCSKGTIQNIQQQSATFSGMITKFCQELGWWSISVLLKNFQTRLIFGIQHELMDLSRIYLLDNVRARALYKCDLKTCADVAFVGVEELESILLNSTQFQSKSDQNNQVQLEQQKIKIVGLSKVLNINEAAVEIIEEAKRICLNSGDLLEKDIDGDDKESSVSTNSNYSSTKSIKFTSIDSSNVNSSVKVANAFSYTKSNNVTQEISSDLSSYSFSSPAAKNLRLSLSACKEKNTSTKVHSLNKVIEIKSTSYSNLKVKSFEDSVKAQDCSNNINKSDKKNSKVNIEEPITVLHPKNVDSSLTTTQIADIFSNSIIGSQQQGDNKNNISMSNSQIANLFSSSGTSFSFVENSPILQPQKESTPVVRLKTSKNILKSSLNSSSNTLSNKNKVLQNNNSLDLFDETISSAARSHELFTRSIADESLLLLKSLSLNEDTENSIHDKSFDTSPLKSSCFNANYKNNVFDLTESCSLFDSFSSEVKKREDIAFSVFRNKEVEIICCLLNPDKLYYIKVDNINNQESKLYFDKLCEILMSLPTNFCIIGCRLHSQLKYIFQEKSFIDSLKCKLFDLNIASWMNNHDSILNHEKILFEKYSNKQIKSHGERHPHDKYVDKAACILASYMEIYLSNKKELQEKKLEVLFNKVEMPHYVFFCTIELNGMFVDMVKLKKTKMLLLGCMKEIQKEAWIIAGRKFNLSSPSEISKILFEELKLSPKNRDKEITETVSINQKLSRLRRKTRQRCKSTKKETLEQLCLSSAHQLPRLIMDWRAVNHALNQNIIPLESYLTSSSTTFSELLFHPRGFYTTSTGRMLMGEPNVQNTPREFSLQNSITKAMSFNLRSFFVVEKAQQLRVFVSADYAQLELRIMAHYSNDPNLLKVFNEPGEADIFCQLAKKMKLNEGEEVSECERQRAKKVCYGILYGMGSLTLAKQLDVTRNEAERFVHEFNQQFPKLKPKLQRIVDKCRQRGYVSTVCGRRRYLDNINSDKSRKRSQAERQAVNTTVQGSAADVIKVASCKIHKKLLSAGYDILRGRNNGGKFCYYVNHMHDELMFETSKENLNEVVGIVRHCMTSSVRLDVSLKVKFKTGSCWGSLKTLDVC